MQKCINCDKTFVTKLALYRHASTAHNLKKQAKNICTYCEKAFKKLSDLVRINNSNKFSIIIIIFSNVMCERIQEKNRSNARNATRVSR